MIFIWACYLFFDKLPKLFAGFPHVAWYQVGIFVMMLFSIFMMFIIPVIIALPRYNELKKRRRETITLDCKKIGFRDEISVIEAKWDDVTDCYWTTKGWSMVRVGIIETKSGSISFYYEIEKYGILTKIVEKYASNVSLAKWRMISPNDSLEPKNAGIDISGPQNDTKRYSYRTRSYRAMIAFPFLWTFIPILGPGCRHMILGDPLDFHIFEASLIPGLLSCYLLAAFYHSSITIDKDGITQISIFGEKRVRWDDVKEANLSSDSLCYFVKSDKCRIFFSIYISDIGELKGEIERRAVNAKIERKENC
jgi:hypothetical protein